MMPSEEGVHKTESSMDTCFGGVKGRESGEKTHQTHTGQQEA